MIIKEILDRKRYLDVKLADVENFIEQLSTLEVLDKVSFYNKALEYKFALLSKIQSHVVLLQNQNNSTVITIGPNTLSVYEAVKIRNTLLEKIKTLDVLIRRGDLSVINVFSLMDQRDSLFEECIVLSNTISISDISTYWEG